MGRGTTYNVVGYAPIDKDREAIVGCMSRQEMAQEIARQAKHGLMITRWYAQTARGVDILGGVQMANAAQVARLLPKLPVCGCCGGWGCACCNYSGIAKRDNHLRWRDWQLEAMRRQVAEEQARKEA